MAKTLTLGVSAHATTGHAPAITSNTTLGRLLHTRILRRRYPAIGVCPVLGTPTTTSPALERQQAIENALNMALHYIRTADTQQAIQAATSKAIRAATLLKQACAELATNGVVA